MILSMPQNPVAQALVQQEFDEVMPGAGMLIGQEPRSRRRSRVRPVGDIQEYAQDLSRKRFGRGHWDELQELVQRESSWNPQADNPNSSAFGLFQFLDSTWDNYGGVTNNPYKQIRKGLRYIRDRYDNPTEALEWHDDHGWY